MPDDEKTLPSPLLQCLETVYRLGSREGSAPLHAVSRKLELTTAVVGQQASALQSAGFLETSSRGRVRLTEAGTRIAVGLVRKHRLLERFLMEELELPWEEVHDLACRLTPVLSDRVADRLAKLLGDPTTCPHGNPIPSANGVLRGDFAIPLDRFKPGMAGTIVRIEPEEGELLRYLAVLGVIPQARFEVGEVAPFGGPVLIRVGGAEYALGRDVASKIFVRET
jgi:DtxR family Mn-dependent transcriptional regulator